MKEPETKMPENLKSKWAEFKSKSEAVCIPTNDGNRVEMNFKESEKIGNYSKTTLTLFFDGQIKREALKYENTKDHVFYSRIEENGKPISEELSSSGVQVESYREEKANATSSSPLCAIF